MISMPIDYQMIDMPSQVEERVEFSKNEDSQNIIDSIIYQSLESLQSWVNEEDIDFDEIDEDFFLRSSKCFFFIHN